MTEDERRIAAIRSFFRAYRKLQKHDNLRLHTSTALGKDTLIEIDRYYGERKGERVLRVTQTDEAAAYEQAADQVENMLKQLEENKEVRKRA